MHEFSFGDDFLLGVASAATQIEGGEGTNSWYDWYEKGHITDSSDPHIANEHYKRYAQDLLLMKKLGIKAYRFGLDWAKIEPEQDVFSLEAIEHYRKEISLMLSYGIKPLLTLHHFTNPMWFESMGAFENDDCKDIFIKYVNKVVEELADLVSEYVTINEPNVYSANGLLFGIWPPGKKSFFALKKSFTNFTRCHTAAYEQIHKIRSQKGFHDTKVGFAMHMRVFDAKNERNIRHRINAKLASKCFQDSLFQAMATGKCSFPVNKHKDIKQGKYYDFLGINYYTRSCVSSLSDGLKEGCPVNDLGWEIYPEGIKRICADIHNKYDGDIYITENGTCDNTDSFRSRYIYEHLYEVLNSSLPVKRYYHWCFTDNFEWLEGQSARFGIVYINYETQERCFKQSAHFISEIIANNGVSEEIFNKYCYQDYKYNNK